MAKMNLSVSAMETYLDAIRTDYKAWSGGRSDDSIRQKMTEEFCSGLSYEVGSKYIKVVADNGNGASVHSFVVNDLNNVKFPLGTILKAATWKAPAKNFGRGSVLIEDFSRVRWTGAM